MMSRSMIAQRAATAELVLRYISERCAPRGCSRAATDELEAKELEFLGWKGPSAGERLIDSAAKEFKKINDGSKA